MSWIRAARHVLQHGCAMVDRDTGAHKPIPDEVFDRCEQCDEHEDLSACPNCGAPRYRGNGVLLDSFTASMLVQIHDALNEANRAKFDGLSITKAVSVGWKLAKPATVSP